MSNRKQKLDPHQMELDFSWGETVDEYVDLREKIHDEIFANPVEPEEPESEFAICSEIAGAVNRMIRRSGLSREQVVDGINAYFGRTDEGAHADPPLCRNPLTLHMLQKYLAKPTESPFPAYYLVAAMWVCKSMEPAQALVDPMGGKVVSEEESRLLTLGKLENSIAEMQKLRRELKGR